MFEQTKRIFLVLLATSLLWACGEEEPKQGPPVIISDTGTSRDTGDAEGDAADTSATDTQTTRVDIPTDVDTNTDTDAGDTDTSTCVPTDCDAEGIECGTISDGCGRNISCGSCAGGLQCLNNVCEPIPDAEYCRIEGALCGEIPDGAGFRYCGDCPEGYICNAQRQCQFVEPVCGNGFVETGEACDNGSGNSNIRPDACRRDCTLPRCGDGVKDAGDICEDGNAVETDACRTDCTRPPHCARCADDSACGVGGECVTALGNACVIPCDEALGAAACPVGYTCGTNPGLTGTFCYPDANACLEICDNGLDDDGDGLADCADDACRVPEVPYCGATEISCTDGVDNDGDGFTDCIDQECARTTACVCPGVVCNSPTPPACTGDQFTTYALPGQCEAVAGQAVCVYTETDTACATPPPTSCGAGNDTIVAFSDGADDCVLSGGNPQCLYAQTVTTCNQPPFPSCDGQDARRIYTDGAADCTNSGGTFSCVYASTVQQCNTPPPAVCSGSDAVEVFQDSASNCSASGGAAQCVYTSTVTQCNSPPANACNAGNDSFTIYDNGANNCTVFNGTAQCAYPTTVTQCNTPPAPSCPGPDTLRTSTDGTADCTNGGSGPTCAYTAANTTCNTPPPAECAPSGDARRAFIDGANNCRNVSGVNRCAYDFTDAPCNTPPARACASDGDAILDFSDGATDCQIVSGAPTCVYPVARTECDSPAAATCAGPDTVNGQFDANNNCRIVSGAPTCAYDTGVTTCNNPPSPVCAPSGDAIRTSIDGANDCSNNRCTYATSDTACNLPPAPTCDGTDAVRTFVDGTSDCTNTTGAPVCSYGSSVAACNTPPANACAPGNDAIRAYADGANDCASGACSYSFTDTDCDTPPPTACAPGNDAIRTYTDGATNCSTASGSPQCSFTHTDAACNTPPAATCNATFTARVTFSDGASDCSTASGSPACTYTPTETLCNAPPAAICEGNTLRTYSASGTCSGGTCNYASSTQNCATTSQVCSTASGTAQCVAPPPTVTGISFTAPTNNTAQYTVLAHGGQFVLTGTNFTGATAINIGTATLNSAQFTFTNSTTLTINALPDSVPVGTNLPLTVTTPAGTSAAYNVTVIHLTINEIDGDDANSDNEQFIELNIGLADDINLSGYYLILYNSAGNSYNPATNNISGCPGGAAFDGNLGTTDITGRYTVGNRANGVGAQECFNDGGFVRASGGVAIVQRANRTPVDIVPTNTAGAFIDAMVYRHDSCGTNPDSDLPPLLLAGSQKCEDTNGNNDTYSVSRCGSIARRDGNAFKSAPRSWANLTNNCQ